MIDDASDIRQVGRQDLVVDVYVFTGQPLSDEVDVSDLRRLGTGTLHSELSEAWRHSPAVTSVRPDQRSKQLRSTEFVAGEVTFLGEQFEGKPERTLKERLRRYFLESNIVRRAYLARVKYAADEEPSVALCVAPDSPEVRQQPLGKEIGEVFAELFRHDEHLDVIVLAESHEQELRGVCSAFFDRE